MAKDRNPNAAGNSRGTPRNPNYPAKTTWDGEFISSELSSEEKAAFSLWFTEEASILDLYSYYQVEGIKISGSRNDKTGSFICAATDKRGDSVNYACTFSSHAGDPVKALALTLWKLEFKFQLNKKWSSKDKPHEDWG